jgi:hypothetical protein
MSVTRFAAPSFFVCGIGASGQPATDGVQADKEKGRYGPSGTTTSLVLPYNLPPTAY